MQRSPHKTSPPNVSSQVGDLNPQSLDSDDNDLGFWQRLIDEQGAAAFLDLQPRTLQGWRYRGGGFPALY